MEKFEQIILDKDYYLFVISTNSTNQKENNIEVEIKKNCELTISCQTDLNQEILYNENEWKNTPGQMFHNIDIARITRNYPSNHKKTTIDEENSEIIEIDWETDIHFYDYKIFEKYDFEKPADFKPKNYKYLYFKFESQGINCIFAYNAKDRVSDSDIEKLLLNFVYFSKYSDAGVFCQVNDKIQDIMHYCFKDILKQLIKIRGIQEYHTYTMKELINILFEPQENEQQKSGFDINLKQFISLEQIQSIIYKRIIKEGIFPIYLEINTQGRWNITDWIQNLFVNEDILPWKSRYHSSLDIGQFHYSFTPNSKMNISKIKERKFSKENVNREFVKLRILDFFPLDKWIERIASYFFESLPQYLKQLKEISFNLKAQEIINNQQKFHKEDVNQQILFKDSLKKIQKSYKKEFNSRIRENDQKIITQNIMMELQKLKINENNDKSSMFSNLTENIESENCSNNFLDKEKKLTSESNNNSDLNSFEKISLKTTREFYNHYYTDLLKKSKILKKFCQIYAESEINFYNQFENNCQTSVANFIYFLKECFNDLIEPLPLIEDDFRQYLSNKRINQNLFKSFQERKFDNISFQSSLNEEEQIFNFQNVPTKLFREQWHYMNLQFLKFTNPLSNILVQQIDPVILDQSLDYFCFFSDEPTKLFLSSIKLYNKESDNPFIIFEKLNNKFKKGAISKDIETIKNIITQYSLNNNNRFSNQSNSGSPPGLNILLNNNRNSNHLKKSIQSNSSSNNQGKVTATFQFLNEPSPQQQSQSQQQSLEFPNNSYNEQMKDDNLSSNVSDKIKIQDKKICNLPYIMFWLENQLFEVKKLMRIDKNQKKQKIQRLKKILYEDMLLNVTYFYYNSIRLHNSFAHTKQYFSYIGFLIIKNPEAVID